MKKRVFNILNFVALNILFFAIYLNFIHKDVNVLPAAAAKASAKKFPATSLKNPVATAPQKQKLPAAEN